MGCYKLGISYAIVTKVKELTETRQYGEAFDLLEGEDIFQSLNPQFLRCCGEVYLENNHFYESREALVRAHIMAPEGNRIIYDLVHLYLKMGYFQKAKQYYEIYQHHAVADDVGTLYLQYMIQKAQRVEAKELLGILEKACEEQYSDEWAFELALLYASLGMKDKMKEECIRLMASFRSSPYRALAESLKKEEYDISNSYFRFPIMEAEEDLETYASIIALEEKQLEKDEQRIHPPAPVILQMEDDDSTEDTPVQGHKEKGFGIRFPFGKKHEKAADKETAPDQDGAAVPAQSPDAETLATAVIETKEEPPAEDRLVSTTVSEEGNQKPSAREAEEPIRQEQVQIGNRTAEEAPEKTAQPAVNEDTSPEHSEEDVSAYIESVMKSVADIEASVAEDLQHPMSFQTDEAVHRTSSADEIGAEPDTPTEKRYQSKLVDVEENLTPKERLERLMKIIEEERVEENKKKEIAQEPMIEEELDLDEFLTDLVGANTISQAMVKSYRDEKKSKESETTYE